MAYGKTFDAATEDTQAQIAALRKQVNQLVDNRLSPAISDYASRAQDAAQSAANYASSYGQNQADAMSDQVRGRPLAAVALAGAVGYILGRFIR